MECEIISNENIKPSSPTPQNLQTYKFSMLDQIFPSMLIPVVLYFPNNAKINDLDSFISQTTQQLKRSLSLISTRFYPLAGRQNRDGQSIDCNDEGVPFVVAKFTGRKLSDLLRNPDAISPRRLLPCATTWEAEEGPDSTVALIQVNYFDCGGIAVGAVFVHRVADAMTIATFLDSWAATTRESKLPVCPNYIAQSMFPQKEEKPMQLGPTTDILKTGKSVMRCYVFDASAISSLKSKSKGATRVEVVSALIWKRFAAASLANGNSVSLVTQTVNLRRRAQPPFPSECFGNFLALAAAAISNENESDLGLLVRKMRDAISKIGDDYVDRMRGDKGLLGYYENLRLVWSEVSHEGADVLPISSWCSFGLYKTDFGWGKPTWITKPGNDSESRFCNMVWLMDTRTGGGIEAWVILDEKYMTVFDDDEELRALASIDPSPLDI